MIQKRNLVLEAAQAAADARDHAYVDDLDPIDIYTVADRLGVRVRFVDISMEGIYKKGPPAMMLLSSLRPLPRRAFTCGHEIGHHVFGHGSTIDELQGDERKPSDQPEEILADAFSSFLLMPTLGIRRAFNTRKWNISDPTPLQIATVACEFGVGYRTLISHLTYVMKNLSAEKRMHLLRMTPQKIRESIIADSNVTALHIVDRHSFNKVADLEINNAIALPKLSEWSGDGLQHLRDNGDFSIYRAISRGSIKVRTGVKHINLRIGPPRYVGLAKFRHLEDPDE